MFLSQQALQDYSNVEYQSKSKYEYIICCVHVHVSHDMHLFCFTIYSSGIDAGECVEQNISDEITTPITVKVQNDVKMKYKVYCDERGNLHSYKCACNIS